MIKKTFQYLKKNRLCLREDFLYLQKDSLKFSAPTCFIYYRPSRLENMETRVAYSVSKKMGNAVVRNRIKRILRECFRLSDQKNLGTDCLIVINTKQRSFFEEDPAQYEKLLRRDFLRGMQKIREVQSLKIERKVIPQAVVSQ